MTGMIEIDDIITEYEATKRKQGFCICYDPKEDKVFSSKKETAATVIITDTQELCFKIMKQYLEEPAIAPYSTECRTKMKNTSNKVVSFLWFFDHIDGAYDFELYESSAVRKAAVKKCKENGLPFVDVVDYSEKNQIHTFLTEKRNERGK